ncbi:5-methyltetrahydropteroyltriglutamate--homocysteine S-methyltransferase [Candidatus Vidania fulgoroideorum]
MFQTHIIGMPIIGRNREIKFLLENYINKKVNYSFLKKEIFVFIKKNIIFQKKNFDLITLGSFIYPDVVSSTLLLLDFLDSDYLNGNNIFDYIKNITRGNNNLKPFKMVKWFGTNFHYFIPKIEKKKKKKLFDFFIKKELKFVKKTKKKTKIIILGPFSLKYILKENSLKLKTGYIINKYKYFIRKYKDKINFFQFEEPFFSDNLNKKLLIVFKKIYKNFENEKIIFTNYFSKIKKNIKHIKTYGIHIDLISNKYKKKFVKKVLSLFKKVSLGIINGNNVWICNFNEIILLLKNIKKPILLSSNCSFIHVPYDIKLEKKNFSNFDINFFSFFLQKVKELSLLRDILNKKRKHKKTLYLNKKLNKTLLKKKKEKKTKCKKGVKKKFISFRKIGLSSLPITTIGSFSQTFEIRSMRKKFLNKKICKDKYFKFIKKNILEIINIQKKNNVNVLSNGEFERSDMAQFFCENIKGFLISKNGWVQSYCTRCVKPPIILNKIKKKKIEIYKWIKFIKLKKPFLIKAIITGPVTLFKWSFNLENLNPKYIIFSIAKILKKEIDLICKKNIKIIQIDEPAIKEFINSGFDEKKKREIIINSFNYMCSSIIKDIQIHTHICYSKLSNRDIKMFKKMSIDVITIESSSNIKNNIKLIKKYKFLKKTEVGLGIYNVHSSNLPKFKKIYSNIKYICSKIGFKRTWVNPDCGLKTRNKKEILLLLEKMNKAVKKIKNNLNNTI